MQYISGRTPRGGMRSPRNYAAGRTCQNTDCDTQLSRYNRREYCHVHAPLKFPRVRGRDVRSSE